VAAAEERLSFKRALLDTSFVAGPIGKSPDCEAGARLGFVGHGFTRDEWDGNGDPPSPQRAFFGQPAKCEGAHTSLPNPSPKVR